MKVKLHLMRTVLANAYVYVLVSLMVKRWALFALYMFIDFKPNYIGQKIMDIDCNFHLFLNLVTRSNISFHCS